MFNNLMEFKRTVIYLLFVILCLSRDSRIRSKRLLMDNLTVIKVIQQGLEVFPRNTYF